MILDQIVEDKKIRLVEVKKEKSELEMRALAENICKEKASEHLFEQALKKPGLSIIGEHKKASPSLGTIESKISMEERVQVYNQAVDAISCLTEEDHFLGSVKDFEEIRMHAKIPMLRKDFMIDSYQFYEAKVIGADAILLIAAILDDAQLKDYYQLATTLGLDALVEVHNEEELERALKIDPKIVGVNNRNLKNFTIELETTKRLAAYMPKEKVFVSESGIVNDEDVAFLKQCQVDAFLIGRAFMENPNAKELAERWKKLYEES